MHYRELAKDLTTMLNCFKGCFLIYFVYKSLSLPVDFFILFIESGFFKEGNIIYRTNLNVY